MLEQLPDESPFSSWLTSEARFRDILIRNITSVSMSTENPLGYPASGTNRYINITAISNNGSMGGSTGQRGDLSICINGKLMLLPNTFMTSASSESIYDSHFENKFSFISSADPIILADIPEENDGGLENGDKIYRPLDLD